MPPRRFRSIDDIQEPNRQGRRNEQRNVIPVSKYLDFSRVLPVELRSKVTTRLAKLITKEIQTGGTVNWDIFRYENETSPIYNEISYYLDVDFHMNELYIFTSQVWRKLFSINEPLYSDLILEFLSTYSFKKAIPNFRDKKAITFRLGGINRSLSVVEFAQILNLYPEEIAYHPRFSMYLDKMVSEQTDKNILSGFWSTIGTGDFPDRYHSATTNNIRKPIIKLFHHLLIHTINSRRGNSNKILKNDLFLLFCIINRIHLNIPFWIAKYLTTVTRNRQEHPITGGGQFITRIARHFGLLTETNISALKTLPPMEILDRDYWLHVGICRENLINSNKLIWAPKCTRNTESEAETMERDSTESTNQLLVEEGMMVEQPNIIEEFITEPLEDMEQWYTSMLANMDNQQATTSSISLEQRVEALEAEVKELRAQLNQYGVRHDRETLENEVTRVHVGVINHTVNTLSKQTEWIRRKLKDIFPTDDFPSNP